MSALLLLWKKVTLVMTDRYYKKSLSARIIVLVSRELSEQLCTKKTC